MSNLCTDCGSFDCDGSEHYPSSDGEKTVKKLRNKTRFNIERVEKAIAEDAADTHTIIKDRELRKIGEKMVMTDPYINIIRRSTGEVKYSSIMPSFAVMVNCKRSKRNEEIKKSYFNDSIYGMADEESIAKGTELVINSLVSPKNDGAFVIIYCVSEKHNDLMLELIKRNIAAIVTSEKIIKHQTIKYHLNQPKSEANFSRTQVDIYVGKNKRVLMIHCHKSHIMLKDVKKKLNDLRSSIKSRLYMHNGK